MHLGTKGKDSRRHLNNAPLLSVTSQTANEGGNKEAVQGPAPDDSNVNSVVKCDAPSCSSKRPAEAFCSDCYQFLCEACLERHDDEVLFQNHRATPLSSNKKKAPLTNNEAISSERQRRPPTQPDLCPNPEHRNRRLEFYCETCTVPVCQSCLRERHAGHTHEALTSNGRARQQRLSETLEMARDLLARLKVAIEGHDDTTLRLEASKVGAVTLVVSTFRELQNSLERRRQVLLEGVERVVVAKRAELVRRREELQRMRDELSQLNEATLRDPESGNLDAAARKVTLAQEKYEYELAKGPSSPGSGCVTLSMDSGWLKERLEHFGIVGEDCAPPLSGWSHVTPPTTAADHPHVLEVQTRDARGSLKRAGDLDLVVELRDRRRDSPMGVVGGGVVSGQVEDHGDGTYTVNLTPPPGMGVGGGSRRQLTVTVNGQHVSDSPYDFHVSGRDYLALSDVRQTYEVRQPQYVAVDDAGNLYASGYRRSHHHGFVDVFGADGARKTTIGCHGNNCGLIDSPRGVAVRGEVVYVADCGNNRVLKLTTGGKLLHSFGRSGSREGEGLLKRPVGVCIDAKGRVVVADSGNHRIQIFDLEGNYLRSIPGNNRDFLVGGGGGGGTLPVGRNSRTFLPHAGDLTVSIGRSCSKDASFYSPYGVAVDPEGNIHVAANNTSSIKVFTPEGDFVRAYGSLCCPTGIAIDSAGFCFVCQSSTSSPSSSSVSSPSYSSMSNSSSSPIPLGGGQGSAVVVFDPKGNPLKMLHGVQGAYGVTVDKEGNVFVADWIKNQVVKY